MTRIVLDAMGGDHAPTSEIEGALMAVRDLDVEITLVGPESRLRQELSGITSGSERGIEVVDAPEVISMGESVAQAVRRKRNSTLRVGMRLVREGYADGFVSAGNTGAIMATAKMVLRTLGKIDRPALAAVLPTVARKPAVLIDVGANAECKPFHLLQFAMMGDVYARAILGVGKPVVGLVSIGEEQLKGNELTREAHKLLEQSGLHFVGNIEGQAIYAGKVDVIVCDGFTGNVILKVSEGTSEMLFEVIKQELLKSIQTRKRAVLLPPAFEDLKQRFGYEEFGGAPLLGVKDVCVICHGRSTGRAIRNAIKVAAELCQKRVPERIETEMAKLGSEWGVSHQGANA
ncbi:MAG: phosphate acyltransferase PlsX [Acidobacteria bacterium]|nr:phosphate acyltransferase PlsX [Acidobacteriota bacterium]